MLMVECPSISEAFWGSDWRHTGRRSTGLAAMRTLTLTGADWQSPALWSSLAPLTIAALLCAAIGYGMLTFALRRAERQGGIGVVV